MPRCATAPQPQRTRAAARNFAAAASVPQWAIAPQSQRMVLQRATMTNSR